MVWWLVGLWFVALWLVGKSVCGDLVVLKMFA